MYDYVLIYSIYDFYISIIVCIVMQKETDSYNIYNIKTL